MTGLLAAHLWQSTLVLMAAWVVTRCCRRNGADFRFLIWFGASAKFLVPLAALQWLGERVGQALPNPLEIDQALVATANALFVPPLPSQLQLPEHVRSPALMLAVAIWACGTLLLCLQWYRQWRAARSTLATSRRLSTDLSVPVHATRNDLGPGVIGILQQVVLLPEAVVRELPEPQLQALLAHESCHIRRYDNLLAAIHKCVEVLFWFHPLVWWVGANLLREREAACDESVLSEGHEPQVYAESILQVCRLSVSARLSGVAASTGGDLVSRMGVIMGAERAQPIDNARFSLLLAAIAVLWFAPFLTGIINGALRAASGDATVRLDAVNLRLTEHDGQHSARFDSEGRQLELKNVSLRQLMTSAYPWSFVSGDPDAIDRIHYDIQARWQGDGRMNERAVYRELLRKVLQTNTNLQLYVDQRCEMECG